MAVFAAVLLGILPVFILIVLGRLVRKRLSEHAWTGLDKLNFELLFPALLFTAAASRPIDVSRVAVIGPSVWAILTLGLVAGYTARRFGPERFLDFAGAWQTAWRFNTAIGFVTAALLTHADIALMAVVAGLAVPVANAFAVSALSRGGSLSAAATLRRVILNPFLLASLAGVAVGMSGFTPPEVILAPLRMMAQAAVPIALLSVGATMDWQALTHLNAFNGILAGVKLLVLPAVTLTLCLLLGADASVTSILTMFAALPTATASHVLAAGFGADRMIPATLVAQTTLLSAATLPFWILLIEMIV